MRTLEKISANKWMLFCFLLIGLSSCSSEETKVEEPSQNVEQQDTLLPQEEYQEPQFLKENIFKGPIIDGFEFKGDLISSYWWEDSNGSNYLINSKLKTNGEDGLRSAYLYSYHYTKNEDGKIELVRLVQDHEEACDFDITLEFLGEPSITDLNFDNMAEVIVVYRKACRSDVSECSMKLIMHDQKGKYALRGSQYIVFPDQDEPGADYLIDLSKVKHEEGEPEWLEYRGRYENSNDFKNAPADFLITADSLWRANAFERFD